MTLKIGKIPNTSEEKVSNGSKSPQKSSIINLGIFEIIPICVLFLRNFVHPISILNNAKRQKYSLSTHHR